MKNLENRFQRIQENLELAKQQILSRHEKIKRFADLTFSENEIISKLNKKRDNLLADGESSQRSALRLLTEKKQLVYFRSANRNNDGTDVITFIHKHSLLSYENDFELHQKLYYCNLCDFMQPVKVKQEYAEYMWHTYVLNMNSSITYLNLDSRIVLLDAKSNKLKEIKIGNHYSLNQVCPIDSFILISLTHCSSNRAWVYILDKSLNVLKAKSFSVDYFFVKVCQKLFFFWNELSQSFWLYDISMKFLEQIPFRESLCLDFDCILANESKIISSCLITKHIKILSMDNLNLIKTIPMLDKPDFMYWICTDKFSKVIVIQKSASVNKFMVKLFDSYGNLDFERDLIFTVFNDLKLSFLNNDLNFFNNDYTRKWRFM